MMAQKSIRKPKTVFKTLGVLAILTFILLPSVVLQRGILGVPIMIPAYTLWSVFLALIATTTFLIIVNQPREKRILGLALLVFFLLVLQFILLFFFTPVFDFVLLIVGVKVFCYRSVPWMQELHNPTYKTALEYCRQFLNALP